MPCRAASNLAATLPRPFKTSDSVILENHGVVVDGNSLSHAFQKFEAFEFAAKTIITEGRFPARLGENAFFITPKQQDHESLDEADFILV